MRPRLPRRAPWWLYPACVVLLAAACVAFGALAVPALCPPPAPEPDREPSPPVRCRTADGPDDAAFLRRVHLDVIGRIPTAGVARAFLDSDDPDRRTRLIDRLLAGSEFRAHLARQSGGATVGRVAGQLFGPDPCDLDGFADTYRASGYDVRCLLRAMLTSDAYQRRPARPLTADQMAESLAVACGVRGRVAPGRTKAASVAAAAGVARDHPDDVASGVEACFLIALSRRPRPDEAQRLGREVQARGYGGVLVGLLESAEFATNR